MNGIELTALPVEAEMVEIEVFGHRVRVPADQALPYEPKPDVVVNP